MNVSHTKGVMKSEIRCRNITVGHMKPIEVGPRPNLKQRWIGSGRGVECGNGIIEWYGASLL